MQHRHLAQLVSNVHPLELDHFSNMGLYDEDFEGAIARRMLPQTMSPRVVLPLSQMRGTLLRAKVAPVAPEVLRGLMAREVGAAVSTGVRLLLSLFQCTTGQASLLQRKILGLDLDRQARISPEVR